MRSLCTSRSFARHCVAVRKEIRATSNMNRIQEFQRVLQEFGPLFNWYWAYIVATILGVITVIRSYMGGPECPSDERIDGKTVVITGASSGTGKETALELARRGARVILAVKDEKAGNEVAGEIKSMPNGRAEVKFLDLSSLQCVRDFAEKLEIDRIDILINNVVTMSHPYEKTKEGFELNFVTNYLGPFLLTQLLLPKLRAAEQGRIINFVTPSYEMSNIHLNDLNLETNYTPVEALGQSQLALILMARHGSVLLEDTNVMINAVNPGFVLRTKSISTHPIYKSVIKWIMLPCLWLLLKNSTQGAQTTVYAAVSKDLENISGKFFRDCRLQTPKENAKNNRVAKKLYDRSLKLVEPYLSHLHTGDS